MSVPNPQPPLPSDPGGGYQPDYGPGSPAYAAGYTGSGSGAGSGSGVGHADAAGIHSVPYEPPPDYLPAPTGSDTGGGTDSSGNAAGSGSGGGAMASVSPADAAALSSAAGTVDAARNYIAGEATSGVGGCYDCVTQVKQYIIDRIVKNLASAAQCRCNCDKELSKQLLDGYSMAAGQTAGVAAAAGQYMPGITPPPEATFIAAAFANAAATAPPYVPGGAPQPQPPAPVPPPVPQPAACTTTPPPCARKWEGWCQTGTGIIAVRPQGSPPLPPNWKLVAIADTEQQAAEQAQAGCPPPDETKKVKLTLPTSDYFGIAAASCDLAVFQDRDKLATFFNSGEVEAIYATLTDLIANKIDPIKLTMESVGIPESMAKWFEGTAKTPFAISTLVIPQLTRLLGCTDEVFLNAARMLSAIGFWEKTAGFDAGQFKKSYEYVMNHQCRLRQLEPDRAIAAYMAGSIDNNSLDTHWAIAGYCPDALRWYLQAARAKPIPAELVRMRMRDVITPSDYHAGMRQLGYLDRVPAEHLFEINYELPPPQELARFMVRDADDPNIVGSLQMDSLFDEKFGPQLQEWARHQGVSVDYMKYVWRSHWTIPGPQQLWEFWHRLRRKKEFGTPAEQQQDIQRALIHNDILPHWFSKYFAVQYKIVPFRQLARVYNQGAINDDELFQSITENGYSDETAKKLAGFFKRLKDDAARKDEAIRLWLGLSIGPDECRTRLQAKGYSDETITQAMADTEQGFIKSDYIRAFVGGEFPQSSVAPLLAQAGVTPAGIDRIVSLAGLRVTRTIDLAQFEGGTLDSLDCKTQLVQYGIPSDRADELIADVQQRVESRRDKACVDSIRRKYFLGYYDINGPDADLINIGIVPERVQLLKSQWECEAAARDKAIPLAKLASWLRDGVLNAVTFVDRVRNLGYSIDDATQLLSDALTNINAQQAKTAEKQAKDQAAAAARNAKAAAQGAAKLQRAQGQLRAARKAAAAAKLRRERALLHAANLVQKQCTCDVPTAVYAVQEERLWLKLNYAFTEDEALQVLITAGEKFKKGSPADYHAIVQADAELLASANEPTGEPVLDSLPSINGNTVPSA